MPCDSVQSKALYQKSECYLKKLLRERLPKGSKFFLFGSRAKGAAGLMADIDIGIQPSKDLGNKCLSDLRDEIEESFVPYNVDLVDFSKTSEFFRQQALKKTIAWN